MSEELVLEQQEKKTRKASANSLKAKAEKARARAEAEAKKAQELVAQAEQLAAEEAGRKVNQPANGKVVREVKPFEIPLPAEEDIIKAVNYGRGSKHKNAISTGNLARMIKNRCPNISSLKEANSTFKAVVDVISEALLMGHGIYLNGDEYALGVLHLRTLKATTRKNLKTGEEVKTPNQVSVRLRMRKKSTDSHVSVRRKLTEKFGHLIREEE